MILLIPTAMLLTVSFFVLVMVSKVEAKSLKIFGWVICVFLWVVTGLILATAMTAVAPSFVRPCGDMSACSLRGAKDWRNDPHHAWMNNPHSKSMLDDPHAGILMESDSDTSGNTMGGILSDKKMTCPGMGDMEDMPGMPEKK